MDLTNCWKAEDPYEGTPVGICRKESVAKNIIKYK